MCSRVTIEVVPRSDVLLEMDSFDRIKTRRLLVIQ